MIFVAVGTQKFQMNRLLRKVEELIGDKTITEPVFAQIGHSDYEPQSYLYSRFLNKEEFAQKIEDSDLVITHGGVGTIITAVKAGKPVIVCPRLAKYGEHVDDHQKEIAESFSRMNLTMQCEEQDNLAKMIQDCRVHKFSQYVSCRAKMVQTIETYLDSI